MREEVVCGAHREDPGDYDLSEVVLARLPGAGERTGVRMLDVLGTLLSTGMGADEKVEVLGREFGLRGREIRDGVSEMCNLSDIVYERGVAEGVAQGRAEGVAQGRAEGVAQGRADALREMLARAVGLVASGELTPQRAASAFGFAEDEILAALA